MSQLGVLAAGFIEKCSASFRRQFQCCVEQFLGSLP